MTAPNRTRILLVVRTVAFSGLLGLLLHIVGFVMMPSAVTTDPWQAVDSTRGEADVIAIGSSRTYCTVMPLEMWRENGVSVLNVTAGVQPLTATHAYLEQVLKTQEPKVVLFELYMVGKDPRYRIADAHNSFDRMPRGIPRARAIMQSVDATGWFELAFPLQAHHNRWPDLQRSDFFEEKSSGVAYARGAAYITDSEPIQLQERPSPMTEAAYTQDLEHIAQMADLCESKGIQFVLFSSPSPWVLTVGPDRLLDRLESDLAPRFSGIAYLDMNPVAISLAIDPEKDFKDELHLNYRGATKISRWLAPGS